jgi:hypothetical protein
MTARPVNGKDKKFLCWDIIYFRLGRLSETKAVWLVISHNVKWILAFSLVFVYASGVLANASGLSQWYSTKLTGEFLSFTNIDFAISQKDTPEMVEEIHDRITALSEVKDVVSMMYLDLRFQLEFAPPHYYDHGTPAYAANGTKLFIWNGLHLASFLGLEERLDETEPLNVSIPEPGMAVVAREIAEELNIQLGENLIIETPFGNVTYLVNGVTDLNHFAIWEKIEDPQALPSNTSQQFQFPSLSSSYNSGQPFQLDTGEFLPKNNLVILSPEDLVYLALNVARLYSAHVCDVMSIKHYVFCERKNMIEPANMELSILNFKRTKEKMELLTSDVSVTFDSLILELLESATPGLQLFSIIAFASMLAALPLYWFVASTLINIFAEGKRREVALLKVKGMSARDILSSYTTLFLLSAGLGSILGAVLQANVLSMLMEGYAGWIRYEQDVPRALGIIFPDIASLVILLILGLILGIVVVWRLVKFVFDPRASRAIEHLPLRERVDPKGVNKFAMLLLAIGLVKVALVLYGMDSTVYFRNPPPNAYAAMALSLFATFDTYALNALAPVFIAYGFADLISARPKLFSGLLRASSYFAGLKRRKISFKILSSEMWRVSGSFLLVTLIISYGITSYINYNSLADHVWKMAGEFTGSDIRIDCTPNVTQQVEETIKNFSQVSDYTRIDVMTSVFTSVVDWGSGGSMLRCVCTLMVIDPEQYNRTVYLDNAPELRLAVTNLENGSIIGLRDVYEKARYNFGQLMTEGYIFQENVTYGKEVEISEWLDLPLIGAYESPETINVSSSPFDLLGAINHPANLADVYGSSELAVFSYWTSGYPIASPLMRYTSEGLLWSTAGFATINETLTDTSYTHLKTHFIIKLKTEANVETVAHDLENSLTDETILITRKDAVDILLKSIPRLAISLAFAEMNCILITAISIASLVAVTVANVARRSNVLSLLRTRGAKKLDGIALFLPEGVFLSSLTGVMGVLIGVLLAVSYIRPLADLVPSLLTKGELQLSYGWSTWIFLFSMLSIFILMHIVATAFPRKTVKGKE